MSEYDDVALETPEDLDNLIARTRADERRRVLRTIHEWAMDREAMGYQQLPFGHLYEKLRREGEQ